MLDKPKELLAEVQKSREYQKIVKEEPDIYLASAFTMKKGEWQLDFYSKKKKTLTSFRKENSRLKVAEDKLFQQKETAPEPLELEEARISLTEALEKTRNELKKSSAGEEQKHIIILQKKDNKIIWNITVLTTSFKVLNIKIDAATGNILSESVESLLNFRAK